MLKRMLSSLSGKLAVNLILVALFSSAVVAEKLPALVYPLMSPRVSSKFGKRKHPIFKVSRHHSGIDLAAPRGAPIRAVRGGTVVFADPYAGYGNLVVIKHENGFTSHYGHCHELKTKIFEKVSAGEIIATVGSTGNSTGPHLHFELRRDGKPLNPEEYVPGLTAQPEG